jgi:ATP-binding cassette subfamily F protein 3
VSLIVCDSVAITFGAVTVLSGVDLRIEARDRLAIVGANGAGKSSLLDVIAGVADPARGSVERERSLRVAYLPQDAPDPGAPTTLAEAMASRADLVSLREEMEQLEQRLSDAPDDLDALLERYGEIQHTYEGQGGYDLEARARAALGGLGLDAAAQGRHPRELSGGQVRRLELAKLLLQDADLLLIDEPTNHLDLAAIEWLEEFLRLVPAALVVVSHDRRFLDRACDRVLELAHGVAEEYPGNYSAYVRLRRERRARRQKEYEAQQAHITHQEDFIRRYKAGQRAREARGRQTKLDRLERVEAPLLDEHPRLRFTSAKGGNVLLRATELVAGRGDTAMVTLERAVIQPGDRIGIVGPNGSGKSTLLHTLAAELAPLSGSVTDGARLRRRLYRQDLAGLDDQRSVLEELLADHPVGEERGRTLLGALLFEGDEVFASVASLSGGERARLALGKLALEQANLLLLDEPTNHLDIPAQEVLEEALLRFDGGLVFVSHDRALIDAVATRVWSIEPATQPAAAPAVIREVLGGYSDLLRSRQPSAGPAVTMPATAPKAAGARQASSRREPRPTRPALAGRRERATERAHGAEVRRIEASIAEVEDQLRGARERLLDPATFADPAAGARAGRDYDRLAGALAELYDRWANAAG